ncbi:hypothetical protein HDU76_011557, partial [Blyttiomyces sp. JEL0837]
EYIKRAETIEASDDAEESVGLDIANLKALNKELKARLEDYFFKIREETASLTGQTTFEPEPEIAHATEKPVSTVTSFAQPQPPASILSRLGPKETKSDAPSFGRQESAAVVPASSILNFQFNPQGVESPKKTFGSFGSTTSGAVASPSPFTFGSPKKNIFADSDPPSASLNFGQPAMSGVSFANSSPFTQGSFGATKDAAASSNVGSVAFNFASLQSNKTDTNSSAPAGGSVFSRLGSKLPAATDADEDDVIVVGDEDEGEQGYDGNEVGGNEGGEDEGYEQYDQEEGYEQYGEGEGYGEEGEEGDFGEFEEEYEEEAPPSSSLFSELASAPGPSSSSGLFSSIASPAPAFSFGNLGGGTPLTGSPGFGSPLGGSPLGGLSFGVGPGTLKPGEFSPSPQKERYERKGEREKKRK